MKKDFYIIKMHYNFIVGELLSVVQTSVNPLLHKSEKIIKKCDNQLFQNSGN